jgi:transcriptional regulator with XRE-family HTH domain
MANISRHKTGFQRVREQHGLTQCEFAEIAGVSTKTVQRWERGISTPRGYSLQRVYEHFHTTPEALGVFDTDEHEHEEIAQQEPGQGAEDSPSKEQHSSYCLLLLLGCLLLALVLVAAGARLA